MKLFPFAEVAATVDQILKGTYTGKHYLAMRRMVRGDVQVVIYQQFNCAGCGMKQEMPDPNVLYTHGTCEECGAVTDIQRDGCNYAIHFMGNQATRGSSSNIQ